MKFDHLILTVYKSGATYKPMIRANSGKKERIYKFFAASAEGFAERERALEFGIQQLKRGRFL